MFWSVFVFPKIKGKKEMMKNIFQIITISGMLGSGKSTVAKLLAERLGYEYYSTGNAQREIAKKRGLTTLELNHLADTDPSIDKEIDGVFQRFNAVPNKNLVIDSRMAFFFVPSSIKIKLNVDVAVAGARIFNDEARSGEKKYASVAESIEALKARRLSEVERFKRIYHVDIDNDENFDYVLDSTNRTPEEIVDLIIWKFRLNRS